MCFYVLYCTVLMSRSKRESNSDRAGTTRKCQTIMMETKVEIIERVDRGIKMVNHSYNTNSSTISLILKNKDKFKEHVKSAVLMMKISKEHRKVREEMEKLLSVKRQDQHQRSVPLSLMLTQEKAESLYENLEKKHKIIDEAMYLSEQVFNMDETGLYWKKKPDRSYIGKDEKLMPGYKAAKDRLTLLFGGNASGNMKFNPLLIYHPENPRTLKNIAKGSLPVVWKGNPKAWAVVQSLSPVCLFFLEKDIPFNNLLLLNNTLGHPPFMDNFHLNIKVVHLPQNTMSLIKPINEGVIMTFKKYYLCHTFCQAVKVTAAIMNGVWKNFCPQFIHNFLNLSKKLKLDLQVDNFTEFLTAQPEELTNEDLMELEDQRKDQERQEEEVAKEPKRFKMQEMSRDFLFSFIFLRTHSVQNANQCYCIIYDEKISTTQMSLYHFFKRVDRVEPSKEPEPVPSMSGMNETAARLHLLLLMTLQLYRLTPPFLLQSLNASPRVPSIVLYHHMFQHPVRLKIFICLFLCIICVKTITNLLLYRTIKLIVLVGYLG
ncbi:hypothetical protein FD755_012770 [Muntiacus reevesi]|uniref:DDE-1 domain-containing protein n=1 Tax=Muntiacus reevesi TaxID=9886 RepID=A0A5N3XQB3_MUNRE|nr:hypothetical protein FD755_012770 [Muntiacus reevesi]